MNRVGQERNSLAEFFVHPIDGRSPVKTRRQRAEFTHRKKPLLFLEMALRQQPRP
jgi:hypothetical protein